MPRRSSNSVRVFFADKDKVLRQLREYAGRLRQTDPNVEKVGFFGSYATDTFGPGSDVDLLIVLRRSSVRFLDRVPDYMPGELCVGCDVFPYTSGELKQMSDCGNSWIRHILSEVIWL